MTFIVGWFGGRTFNNAEMMIERITVKSYDGTRLSDLYTKFMGLLHGCPKFDF